MHHPMLTSQVHQIMENKVMWTFLKCKYIHFVKIGGKNINKYTKYTLIGNTKYNY